MKSCQVYQIMRAEDRFLHNCITSDFNSISRKQLKDIAAADPDWGYILRRARHEGLVSVVYQALLDEGLHSKVPVRIWQDFERGYYTVATRNSLLLQDLQEILRYLDKEEIEVILLKGMALLATIYPNPALRPMYDIDILIPEREISRVADILTGLGYSRSDRYPEDFHRGDMMVDLHWDLMNTTRVRSRRYAYSIDRDGLWAESTPISVEGRKARILSTEDFLLDLCIHLSFHHGMQGLMWFSDISRFIEYQRNKIDWDRFAGKSIDAGIAKPVYYVLLYLQHTLGQDIPAFVLDRLKPQRETFIERRVIAAIVEGRSLENVRFFFTLSSIENLFDKIHFLREIAFPSPKVLSARHGIRSRQSLARCYLLHLKAVLRSVFRLAANLLKA